MFISPLNLRIWIQSNDAVVEGVANIKKTQLLLFRRIEPSLLIELNDPHGFTNTKWYLPLR